MTFRTALLAIALPLLALSLAGCTGGEESSAQTMASREETAKANAQEPKVDPSMILHKINPAIPIFENSKFRPDLTKRDATMLRNQYGPETQVYTLETDNAFPEVWHYYVTYLAQFRGYEPPTPYPPEGQNWRTLEVDLNQAMQDPFIPGDAFAPNAKQVILQVAETEAEPETVIRYIITSQKPMTLAETQTSGRGAVQPAATPEGPAEESAEGNGIE